MKQKIKDAACQMASTYHDMMDIYHELKGVDGAERICQAIVATSTSVKIISKMIERLNKGVKSDD